MSSIQAIGRGAAVGALAYGKVMPYIGDGARGQAVSQKNEQFGDVMDGGYIAHVWLRDGALILSPTGLVAISYTVVDRAWT